MSAVIYVEAEDDARSILAKMELVQGATVGVIVPAGRVALDDPVSLRLVRRQAEALGLELGIVTQDPDLKDRARAEGVRIYRSPASYERSVQRRAARPDIAGEEYRQGPGSPWATLVAVAVICLILVAVVLVVVPEMSVVVDPQTTVLSQTIQVVADPSQATVDANRLRIPAQSAQLVVEADDQATAGEGEPAGDGKARGIVAFTNRTQERIDIPVGTALWTTGGIRFLTEQSATLPGGIGQTTTAPVVAEVAGDQGNVQRLQITSVETGLDTKVYTQNGDATAGGGLPGSRVVTSVDRERLLKRVTDKARADAEAKLKSSLAPGQILLDQTLQFTPQDTEFDGEVGQEVDVLALRLRARVTCLIVSADDLDRIGGAAWQPEAPPGYSVVPGSLTAGAPEVFSVEGRTAVLRLGLEETAQAQLNVDQMQELARWRTADDAGRLLSQAYDLSSQPAISFTPGWAQRAYRVDVVVRSTVPQTTP